ncbi:MAG: GTP-binding protein, partial [Bradyrhizobium sp.]|nr:GTP-binding protein [Bradyrhizobium sp.]
MARASGIRPQEHRCAGTRAVVAALKTRALAMTKSYAKTPCTIVTGFLGAGKTTLVRNLIETANGR